MRTQNLANGLEWCAVAFVPASAMLMMALQSVRPCCGKGRWANITYTTHALAAAAVEHHEGASQGHMQADRQDETPQLCQTQKL